MKAQAYCLFVDTADQCKAAAGLAWPDGVGLRYRRSQLTPEQLADTPSTVPWQSVELDLNRFIVVDLICTEECLSATDPRVLGLGAEASHDAEHFLSSLVETSLLARDDDHIVLTSVECRTETLPDGRLIAVDDKTRLLTRRLERYLSDRGDVAQGA